MSPVAFVLPRRRAARRLAAPYRHCAARHLVARRRRTARCRRCAARRPADPCRRFLSEATQGKASAVADKRLPNH